MINEEQAREYEREISKAFEKILRKDDDLIRLKKKITAGIADQYDLREYALTAGQKLNNILRSYITAENLPEGITYDLAKIVIERPLRNSWFIVQDACEKVQLQEYAAEKIGLNAIKSDANEETINAACTTISNAEELTSEVVSGAIDAETWNMEAMDEFQKINTDFLYAAGINSLVSRSYEGPHFDPHLGKGGRGHQTGGMRDCRYCKERATNGFVDYEKKRNDPEFWKRHRGCRCLIVTKLAHEREFQTAWSKNTGKNIRELYMQEQKKVM